jgi:hypothetical protein
MQRRDHVRPNLPIATKDLMFTKGKIDASPGAYALSGFHKIAKFPARRLLHTNVQHRGKGAWPPCGGQ